MIDPVITFPVENPTALTLTFNAALSGWTSETTYSAIYDVAERR